MIKVMFLGLGHLSKGDVSIAADFARRLSRTRFRVGFVCAVDSVSQVRSLGLPAMPLDGGSPADNLAAMDRLVASFRPECIVAADAFTVNYSAAWSGLSIQILRDRYGRPLASFDQYDWRSANYSVDFYGSGPLRFPALLDDCDLLIRNCPLNQPAPAGPSVVPVALAGGGLRDGGPYALAETACSRKKPVVFIVNSKWEYVNVGNSPELAQLMEAVPHIIHSHLAGLGRPLSIVHVGPVRWQFPVADNINYLHLLKLPPSSFHERLVSADLFLTANAASVTLSQAVLAGVPSLLLQNFKILEPARLGDTNLAWLREAAPRLAIAYPFRVFPWGWHRFLTPVLDRNPYSNCFITAPIFERNRVLEALTMLLEDAGTRAKMRASQIAYRDMLASLTSPDEALSLAMRH